MEIISPNRPNEVTCAFNDAAGRGHLPPDALIARGTVRFEVHRLRTTPIKTVKWLDRAQVEFDYALDHLLELID